MRICYGWARKPLNLSSETRYYPEHLMSKILPFLRTRSISNPLLQVPVWVDLDNQYIRLESEAEALLACRLVSIYHNGPDCRAPPDDEWEREAAQIELHVALHTHAAEGRDSGIDEHEDYIKVEL